MLFSQKHGFAARAPFPASTSVLYPWYANAVARLACTDAGPHCHDFANRLVARRALEVAGQFTARLMYVRLTHPARAHLDQNLVFAGLRSVDFLYFPVVVRGRDNNSIHVLP